MVAPSFVWLRCSRYAIREGTSRVKIFKNFKEKKSFKPEFGAEGIFGGHLLGVTSSNSLSFYDWESLDLIRRIEISVKHVNLHTLTPSHTHTLTHSHCRCTGVRVAN